MHKINIILVTCEGGAIFEAIERWPMVVLLLLLKHWILAISICGCHLEGHGGINRHIMLLTCCCNDLIAHKKERYLWALGRVFPCAYSAWLFRWWICTVKLTLSLIHPENRNLTCSVCKAMYVKYTQVKYTDIKVLKYLSKGTAGQSSSWML